MNKIKVLTYSFIILILLNLGMVLFFMVLKPREFRNHRNGPRKMIIEKLHFDTKQQAQYESLVENHITEIKAFENKIQQTKENLYSQLSQTKVNLKSKDSLITTLGDLQKQIETERFNHFKKIKEICNSPEQKEDFKELTVELSKMFSHRGRPQEDKNHK